MQIFPCLLILIYLSLFYKGKEHKSDRGLEQQVPKVVISVWQEPLDLLTS